MSQFWAGYQGWGLLLNETEFNTFLKTYCRETSQSLKTLTEMIDDDGVEECPFVSSVDADCFRQDIEDKKQIDYHDYSTFDLIFLSKNTVSDVRLFPFKDKNGKIKYNPPVWYHDQDAYILFFRYDCSSANYFNGLRYDNYKQFINEFKKHLQHYLPKDFNWDAHVGNITYVEFA